VDARIDRGPKRPTGPRPNISRSNSAVGLLPEKNNVGGLPFAVEARYTGLADPKIKAAIADMGGTVLAGSPADFGKLIADETEKWGKVVKFSGAKPD
jgi:hypothetical protein